MSGVIIAATNSIHQLQTLPTIWIDINNCHVSAVTDTGAQVTAAGISYLQQFGLTESNLKKPPHALKHVGGGYDLTITYKNMILEEPVYFVKYLDLVFLSLHACKCFRLVHQSFPNVQLQDDENGDVQIAYCQMKRLTGDTANHQSNHQSQLTKVESSHMPHSLPDRPERIPLSPTEENIDALQQWLLNAFSSSTFNTGATPLPIMSGDPQHIHLVDGAQVIAAHTPISIPHHWKAEIKRQLDEDVEKGILRKVSPGTPVDWCMRMVSVPKSNGSPRRTVGYQPLNKFSRRETHLSPTPFDAVSAIPPHAYHGYHQVALDAPSQNLTTFITEYGRYQYLRTPQGLMSAGDAYIHRYDEIIDKVPRKVKVVDDTLLYSSSIEQSFYQVFDYLYLCVMNGITLNPLKFKFCQRDIDVVGIHISWERFMPSNDMMSSVKCFPMPTQPTISDIRAWFGLINQLAPFLITTEIMKPFRELLKSKSKLVYWDDVLQPSFEYAKVAICKLIETGLSCYNKGKKTAVITDWSRNGMGFLLVQQDCQCIPDGPFCCANGRKLIYCGSRCLTPAEENYSVPEGEALEVAWALKKCKMFLLGHPCFTIFTDHRPLLKILGEKELRNINNPCLFRMKERTLMYRFTIIHIPGKKNTAANTLSRYPLKLCLIL